MNTEVSKTALRIDPKDNVATVMEKLEAGERVNVLCREQVLQITATEPVPKYFKIAIADIEKDAQVIKYGERIGDAAHDIKTGQCVHTHNVVSG